MIYNTAQHLVSHNELTCDSSSVGLEQRFSTGVPQEFIKQVIPGYLVRGTGLFSLRLSNLKK